MFFFFTESILGCQQLRCVKLSDINKAVTLTLKNAIDWDGHRGPRTKDQSEGSGTVTAAAVTNISGGRAIVEAEEQENMAVSCS